MGTWLQAKQLQHQDNSSKKPFTQTILKMKSISHFTVHKTILKMKSISYFIVLRTILNMKSISFHTVKFSYFWYIISRLWRIINLIEWHYVFLKLLSNRLLSFNTSILVWSFYKVKLWQGRVTRTTLSPAGFELGKPYKAV